MFDQIPGTTLPFSAEAKDQAFSVIAPILSATGGLTLSQLCELTGLNPTTPQNWIKRGWVASPRGKRYHEIQVARILLINLLRGSMQLDGIAALMAYINGSVEDLSDDIIPDRLLYNHLCGIVHGLKKSPTYDPKHIRRLIDERLAEQDEMPPEAREKLGETLLVMTLAYVSSEIRGRAEEEFAKLSL